MLYLDLSAPKVEKSPTMSREMLINSSSAQCEQSGTAAISISYS